VSEEKTEDSTARESTSRATANEHGVLQLRSGRSRESDGKTKSIEKKESASMSGN
jgi:hypothetical protein